MSENQNNEARNFETGGESSPFLTTAVALLLAVHFARAVLPEVNFSQLQVKLPTSLSSHGTVPPSFRRPSLF